MVRTPCQDWIETQIKGNTPATANALAIKWGVPSSYLARWLAGGVPEYYRIPHLSERSGTPVAELERIFFLSKQIKSAERHGTNGVSNLIQCPTKPGAKVTNSRLYRGELRHAVAV